MNIREQLEEARRISEESRNARKIHGELQNARKIHDELTNYRNSIAGRNNLEDFKNQQNAIKDLRNYGSEIQRIKEFHNFPNRFGIPNNLLFKNELLEPIRSLQKMLEREKSLTNNSLFDARKNFQNINHIAERNYRDSIFQAQRELDSIRRDYFKNLPKWQEQLIPALSVRRSEAENIVNNIKQFKEQFDLLPRNFRKQEFWNEIDSIRNTYVGNLAASMRDAIFDSENEQEAFGKLETLVEEKLESLPQGGFSRVELLTLVISILSLLLAFYQSGLSTYQFSDSQKSSQEQKASTEKLVQLLEKIAENTNEIEKTEDVYYLVERNLSVKKKPSFKSMTIDFLSAKTKVRLLKTNHKWILIEYIDYLEIVPKYGWVNKKYLVRVEKGNLKYKNKINIDESDIWTDEDLYDFSNASLNYADELFEETK